MKQIWKWRLDSMEMIYLDMPEDAEILDVQVQGGTPCIWAICSPGSPVRTRKLALYGTGEPIIGDPGRHIGTFQISDGRLVLHVFEIDN